MKIGKSSRPVDVRSKELDNTTVPLPFKIFATMKTTKYNEVEKLVHKTIDRLTDLRFAKIVSSSMLPPNGTHNLSYNKRTVPLLQRLMDRAEPIIYKAHFHRRRNQGFIDYISLRQSERMHYNDTKSRMSADDKTEFELYY